MWIMRSPPSPAVPDAEAGRPNKVFTVSLTPSMHPRFFFLPLRVIVLVACVPPTEDRKGIPPPESAPPDDPDWFVLAPAIEP